MPSWNSTRWSVQPLVSYLLWFWEVYIRDWFVQLVRRVSLGNKTVLDCDIQVVTLRSILKYKILNMVYCFMLDWAFVLTLNWKLYKVYKIQPIRVVYAESQTTNQNPGKYLNCALFNEKTLIGRNLVRLLKNREKEWMKQKIKSVHNRYSV